MDTPGHHHRHTECVVTGIVLPVRVSDSSDLTFLKNGITRKTPSILSLYELVQGRKHGGYARTITPGKWSSTTGVKMIKDVPTAPVRGQYQELTISLLLILSWHGNGITRKMMCRWKMSVTGRKYTDGGQTTADIPGQ